MPTDYDSAIAAFEALPDDLPDDERRAHYEAHLFPLARARLRPPSGEVIDQLILTVGGQAYSVSLSLEATPARRVVFLVTETSQPSAEKAAAWVLGPNVDRSYERVDKVDAQSVYRKILDAHEDYLQGRERAAPGSVAVDITSGTKAMTAAASSAAVVIGAVQRYVESRPFARERQRSYHAHERVHTIPHPLVTMGDLQRREAERLFDRGAFDHAARLFAELDERGAQQYRYRERYELAQAYAHAERLEFAPAAALLDHVTRRLAASVVRQDPLCDLNGRLGLQRDMLGLLAGQGASPTPVLLRFLIAYARRREAQGLRDAAALVHYRTIELAIHHRLESQHGLIAGDATADAYAAAAARAAVTVDVLAAQLGLASPADLPNKIALMTGWRILGALGDPLAKAVSIGQLQGRTEARNRSIFAHGHQPLAAKAYADFVETAAAVRARLAQLEGWELPDPDDAMTFVTYAGPPISTKPE